VTQRQEASQDAKYARVMSLIAQGRQKLSRTAQCRQEFCQDASLDLKESLYSTPKEQRGLEQSWRLPGFHSSTGISALMMNLLVLFPCLNHFG
jgi:hypothetical protein